VTAWTRTPHQAEPFEQLVESRPSGYTPTSRPITELSYLDATGKEQLHISRLAMERVRSQDDYSKDPRFTVPRSGQIYYGPGSVRKESEPYMTIALPSRRSSCAMLEGTSS
jgi:hypothetical protein